MSIIRLTKLFTFEAAHALDGYDGKCRHIHGHSYRLSVTVKGSPLTDENDPKCGMTLDFGELKRIVNEEIVDKFDHSLVVHRADAADDVWLEPLKHRFGNIIEVDYRPTCENMLTDFAERLQRQLPEGVMLYSLKMYETAPSCAGWYADDNCR